MENVKALENRCFELQVSYKTEKNNQKIEEQKPVVENVVENVRNESKEQIQQNKERKVIN